MKNKEYYNLKDLRFRENDNGEVQVYMGPLRINGTPLITLYNSIDEFMAWLEREKKPELSEDEKVILRNLATRYKWILRSDDCCTLYLSTCEPERRADGTIELGTNCIAYFDLFDRVFENIGMNEYYSIEELLND